MAGIFRLSMRILRRSSISHQQCGKYKNANVYWHPTTGLTIEQIHSALGDILTDTIGGYWESAGRSDIGDTYDSVLSILQLGLWLLRFCCCLFPY